jgi:hypothetical protein
VAAAGGALDGGEFFMITIASIGRFHFFEQARALDRLGLLRALVTDYPRARLAAAGISSGCAIPRPELAITRILRPSRWTFAWAGQRLAASLSRQGGVWNKLNSAFAREALAAGVRNVIVDHGSLHERAAEASFEQEAARAGVPGTAFGGNHRMSWLVDREQEEFERASMVLVLSELARESLARHGVDRRKIEVCWPAVDAGLFARRGPAEAASRPFRVIQISSLSYNKGVHRTLAAWRRLALPHAELWLVGGGNWPEALPPGVRVIGPVPQTDLPALLSQCDLFVLPSLADGFGLVVLQAMACELPVIVSPWTGAAEAVAGQPWSRVAVSVEDVEAAIAGFAAESRPNLRDLGRMARAAVLGRFRWMHHAERLAGILAGRDSRRLGAALGPVASGAAREALVCQ